MKNNSELFAEIVGSRNVWQKKYLDKMFAGEMTAKEKEELETVLDYFKGGGNTLEEIASAYLLFVNDTLKETRYFKETGHYRYRTFAETADKVYYRNEYMSQYMMGLQLSGYIWKNHLVPHRWFKSRLESFAGENYLEIGPGHGQYFLEAVNLQNFKRYYGIDISESSVKLTRDWCEKFKKEGVDNYELILDDFLTHPFAQKFDGVCMSEVLEHLEHPKKHLRKIFEITNHGADIYILVPINAPAIDHIYLFHNIEEVFCMVTDAGFTIKDYICAIGNDISYEKALEKKSAINLALHMVR